MSAEVYKRSGHSQIRSTEQELKLGGGVVTKIEGGAEPRLSA